MWARKDSNLEPIGYEPTALPLSYRPLLLKRAADGIRTRENSLEGCCVTTTPLPQMTVGAAGLEPAASRSQTERSAKLSYAPETGYWLVYCYPGGASTGLRFARSA